MPKNGITTHLHSLDFQIPVARNVTQVKDSTDFLFFFNADLFFKKVELLTEKIKFNADYVEIIAQL